MAKTGEKEGSAAPSLMQTVIAATLVGLIGGGGGFFLGFKLLPESQHAPSNGAAPAENAHADATATQDKEKAASSAHDKAGHDAAKTKKPPAAPTLEVKELPPIVTNLGEPASSWIRIQAAILVEPAELKHADKLSAQLMSDFIAFLRAAPMRNLEGADGLRRLQEELSERAAIRSEGVVRDVIIESMVVQ